MEKYLNLDISGARKFYTEEEYTKASQRIAKAYQVLLSKEGAGNDYLGWLDLPMTYDHREVCRIKQAAGTIQENSDVLLAIGIGGSYLGARSAIEMLKRYFNQKGVEVIFVGNQISGTYVSQLIDYLKDKDFSINVISKSGTTTEPAIAFRILRSFVKSVMVRMEQENVFLLQLIRLREL